MTTDVICEPFTDDPATIARCLEKAGAAALFRTGKPIMLKPNLVNDSSFPVTTSPDFCRAVFQAVRRLTDAPVVIAEGCGDARLTTMEVFARLGYDDLARELDIALIDLNEAPLVKLQQPHNPLFDTMWLPGIAFQHILISLPVLKAHSLSDMTGSMKNMIGLAPPEYYSGRFGTWKKAVFHHDIHQSIVDLNRFRTPDFTLMDASVGLADYHLGGARCDPPVNRILAGTDARAVDRKAAALLHLDWRNIPYLSRVHHES